MNNKQIIIDISRLVKIIRSRKRPTGVDRACLEYIKQYSASAIALVNIGGHYFFLKKDASREIFALILTWSENNSLLLLVNFFIKLVFAIDFRFRSADGYVLNIGHTGICTSKKHNKLKLVFMLHDLIPFEYPEYANFSNKKYKNHKIKINNVIDLADTIICNSQDTKKHLQHYASVIGKQISSKTEVALLGNNLRKIEKSSLSHLPLKHINKPYFVAISTIEPRKNHIMLLNIWRRFAQDSTNSNEIPNLIIIGRRGWKCSNVTDMLDNCITIKNNVFELNNCNDVDLQAYIMGARALLFPSFVEGFGIPVIEALNLGTPAIISDIPVFHEIAGEVPEYIDPLDALSWMKMIMEYTKPDSIMRLKQIERMKNYTAPTWEEHFKIVDEVLGLNHA